MSLDEETSQLHRNLLRRRGKLRRVAVVGALLGIAVGVVGAAAAREWDPGPATPSTNASDATAGTPDQISADRDASGPGLSADAAIAQVLASLGDSSVISATVMQPPVAGSSNPVGSAPWLDIHIDSDQGDGTKQVWLGQLVQGAVADLTAPRSSTATAPATRSSPGWDTARFSVARCSTHRMMRRCVITPATSPRSSGSRSSRSRSSTH
jgi:hypothetical protein